MARALIGITAYVEPARWGPWDVPATLVPHSYVRAVQAAGGIAAVLPPGDAGIEVLGDRLDGLILTGGSDIDPQVYGATRHPETTGTRPDRDAFEVALLQAAVARALPVLTVCRGMQILNVARGGDLVQHLPDVTGADAHRQALGVFARHDVTIEAGTKLAALLGDRALVPSHHHQAPGRVGEGLVVAARAHDGVIEALEDPERDFLLGVLWHPEEGEDRALFEALVASAGRRKEHV